MLRRLLLLSVLFGCLLPAVEYEPAASKADGTLTPGVAPECGDAGDCCTGPDCAAEPPSDAVCAALDGGRGPSGACAEPEAPPLVVPLVPIMPTPRCDDQVVNQDETDVDCGGTCAATCVREQRCRADRDCAQGLFCAAATGRCTEVSCADSVQNGMETLTDCGGGACPGCGQGAPCQAGTDCASGVCGTAGNCVAPACEDGVVNGDETDVDCGGACGDCAPGNACAAPSDCQSAVCGSNGCAGGVRLCCQAAACNDGVRNGNETALDCGGACGLCALGSACSANQQCSTGLCQQGSCRSPGTCTDNAQNGTETDVDCGGSSCPLCADRSTCTASADCVNNSCFEGICISCGSGVLDGTETDVDCGGADPFCRRCEPGLRCLIGSDCQSGVCVGGFC